MNKIILYSVLTFCLCMILSAQAQTGSEKMKTKKGVAATEGINGFPALQFNEIPGAPKLSSPITITDIQNQPLLAEGFGLAAPAWYDWDGDGLKDLLIGEFGSGLEHGRMVGNFLRLYKNTGTADAPKFSGRWEYALPPAKIHSSGTPYSSNQFCCIGFTPAICGY